MRLTRTCANAHPVTGRMTWRGSEDGSAPRDDDKAAQSGNGSYR
jgi:hypothetical protein